MKGYGVVVGILCMGYGAIIFYLALRATGIAP